MSTITPIISHAPAVAKTGEVETQSNPQQEAMFARLLHGSNGGAMSTQEGLMHQADVATLSISVDFGAKIAAGVSQSVNKLVNMT